MPASAGSNPAHSAMCKFNDVKPGELWDCHGMTVKAIKNDNQYGFSPVWEVEIVSVTLQSDHPFYGREKTIKFLQIGARTTWPLGLSELHWVKVRDAICVEHVWDNEQGMAGDWTTCGNELPCKERQ